MHSSCKKFETWNHSSSSYLTYHGGRQFRFSDAHNTQYESNRILVLCMIVIVIVVVV
ncbi:hypothetical protein BDV26DRAFT_266894 [Aspergillus bertholletiae]|uniref:Uncharacterized protein n=1 Tax=Aspergillus bertholletiae TaxID=1226010 RepID=A0A5N7B1P4_9EURO|nr:hypothetical protein BDV26DRAFT_266894 [Aspergillus bertholletiae]